MKMKFRTFALIFALSLAFVLSSGAGFATGIPCTEGVQNPGATAKDCTVTTSATIDGGTYTFNTLTLSGVTLSTDSASLAINAANILGGGSISTPATSTYNSGGAVTITATNTYNTLHPLITVADITAG